MTNGNSELKLGQIPCEKRWLPKTKLPQKVCLTLTKTGIEIDPSKKKELGEKSVENSIPGKWTWQTSTQANSKWRKKLGRGFVAYWHVEKKTRNQV